MADQVSVSVGDLFMGALVPGVGLGLLYMVFVFGVGITRPDLVPPRPAGTEKLTVKQLLMAFASTIPTFGLIPVSYTHLDVYKRQVLGCVALG